MITYIYYITTLYFLEQEKSAKKMDGDKFPYKRSSDSVIVS